jgi:hypothetical protein
MADHVTRALNANTHPGVVDHPPPHWSKQEVEEAKQAKVAANVTFFSLITVHIMDYHWDRHSYFVIYSYHAQTMTHTPPSDDSLLIHLLVVLVACDSD